jgi:hypothetical protein
MTPAIFLLPVAVIVVIYLVDVGWDSTPRPRDDDEKDSDRQAAPGEAARRSPGPIQGSG